MKGPRIVILLLLCYCTHTCCAQNNPDPKQDLTAITPQFFHRIQAKAAQLEGHLSDQTDRYVQRMARREARLQKKLYKGDSTTAKALFAGSAEQYAALSQRMMTDTGRSVLSFNGEYQPYIDSLQGMLRFLKDQPGAAEALTQLNTLQAKLQDANQIREYARQRKQQIAQYLQEHASLLKFAGKDCQAMNQDVYYYSQQLRGYKATLNDPDKLEKEALLSLNKLPAFQAFMQQHSLLAGLFNLPANYGNPGTLAGLQTRDQVAALINQQIATAGAGGGAALQTNLQSAQSQLDGYKDKLSKLGSGSGDMDMPNFIPDNQKTKTFWGRLEYGTNFQTTRDNYYFPTTSDFGLSVGYKLKDKATLGVGASYKLGWGNGIQHVAFSSQGVGLRSFIDVGIKGSFYLSGGLEYNYAKPFSSYQQLRAINEWSRSGLLGISKIVSLKSRVFKKTKVQLLWDFLSYQQIPKTQALLFRIGYTWK